MGQASNSLVSSISSAITQMEGVNPNFVGNNNPGNLVYIGPNQNGQTGVTRGAGGFAAFPDLATGQAALYNQIQGQINSGQNLTQFFNQYAPSGTCNAAGGCQTSQATQNYINFVSQQTGIDPSVPLNSVASGSYDPSAASPSDTGATFDLSSLFPSGGIDLSSFNPFPDASLDLGGVVLSGNDLFLLGLVVVAGLAVSAIL
jgi:hypothetical protein